MLLQKEYLYRANKICKSVSVFIILFNIKYNTQYFERVIPKILFLIILILQHTLKLCVSHHIFIESIVKQPFQLYIYIYLYIVFRECKMFFLFLPLSVTIVCCNKDQRYIKSAFSREFCIFFKFDLPALYKILLFPTNNT